MTTVSVIIPAHPARILSGKLSRALHSVYVQTRLPDAIHIAVDTTRAGAPATRQRALNAADTDWVAFLDSDDLFEPRHLELLLKHAEASGADYAYSWFRILQEFADGTNRIFEGDERGDGVFPMSHYTQPFDPDNPIETTITVLVRRELAQEVGFKALDRGEANTGEDFGFLLGCLKAGAKVSHLKRKTWLWGHHWLVDPSPGDAAGVLGNTGGHPSKGDAA